MDSGSHKEMASVITTMENGMSKQQDAKTGKTFITPRAHAQQDRLWISGRLSKNVRLKPAHAHSFPFNEVLSAHERRSEQETLADSLVFYTDSLADSLEETLADSLVLGPSHC